MDSVVASQHRNTKRTINRQELNNSKMSQNDHQGQDNCISAVVSITRVGKWSSICGGTFTAISAVAFFPLLFDFDSNSGINYLCWLLVALSYLIMAVSNKHAVMTSGNGLIVAAKLFYADLAVTFATIYACYECAVYYLQLTYLRRIRSTDSFDDIIGKSLIEDEPGTPIFAIDLLGYFLLSVSTVFLALSLAARQHGVEETNRDNYTVLKYLLLFHGCTGMTCIAVPALPMIYDRNIIGEVEREGGGKRRGGDDDVDDDVVWQYILLSWCAQFAPICFMMSRYFSSFQEQKQKRE